MNFLFMRNQIYRIPTQLGALFLSWVICASSAFAHQTGNSYLTLKEADGQFMVELDFIVRDLGNLLQVPGQPLTRRLGLTNWQLCKYPSPK